MNDFKDQTLMVTGASGHFGWLAVDTLLTRGATRLIAGSRDPAKLADLAARGVTVRRLDFDDAGSLATAFAAVDRVLLISTDAVGNRIAQQKAAIKAAEAAGVQHIVYTSAPSPRPNAGGGAVIDHFWTEQALAASGIDWTVLRNHLYTDFIVQMSAGPALASGHAYDATNGRGRGYVTRADTARTAAGALLEAEGKTIHDVTGPASITQDDVVALIAQAGGKPVTRIGVTPEQLKAGMVGAGVPAEMADILVAFDVDTAAGLHDVVMDTVERFSGRKPQSVADYIAEHGASLRS